MLGAIMRAKEIRTGYYNEWTITIMDYGGVNMPIFKRKKISLDLMADIENATACSAQNAVNIEDVTLAMLELGELFAEQDDAIVELAELIIEQEEI